MKTLRTIKISAVALLALSLGFVCAWGEDSQKQISPNDDPTRQLANSAASLAETANPNYPVSVFYSSGDAIVEYKWMPMDSEATCKEGVKLLAKRYNCDRLLWREANTEWVMKWNAVREDSPWFGDMMTAGERINRDYKTSEHTWNAAREKGMQFWGVFHLFDYGGKAECYSGGDNGMGAFASFDPWLVKHPEYCLWDRPRITYMSGMIEYGQPEVRKEYLRRIEEMFRGPWSRYEGIFLYSFVEHMEAQYTDEYIYSDFAVKDFKDRFGVDVRTEAFDLEKYYAMRGEYITQYLRELRPLFHKYNKKLAVALNAENMEWPQLWLCGMGVWPKDATGPRILQQGRVKMDWRTWVKEGLVDELHVWGGTGPDKKIEDVKSLLDAVKGTGVKVTVFYQREFPEKDQDLYAEGVRRVVSADDTCEQGDSGERPASEIDSRDPDAVLNVLFQARKKTLELPVEKMVTLLLKHPNPMVRRQAANTIGTLKLQAGVAALEEAAINDPEGSVKSMAIQALGKVNGPHSVAAMARGFSAVNTFPVRMALRDALAAMGPDRYADVAAAYDTKDDYFRTVLLQSFSRRNGTPEYLTVLKKAIEDPNEKVRWWAAYAFAYNSARPENVEILLKALDDPSGAVQCRVAMTLKGMIPKISEDLQKRCFETLLARYEEFGAGCKRTDADWGWRPIGEVLRDGFREKGRRALLDILNGKNSELAGLTWRVLFKTNDGWHPVTKEEMERRYRFYPGGPDHGKCTLTEVAAALDQPGKGS